MYLIEPGYVFEMSMVSMVLLRCGHKRGYRWGFRRHQTLHGLQYATGARMPGQHRAVSISGRPAWPWVRRLAEAVGALEEPAVMVID